MGTRAPTAVERTSGAAVAALLSALCSCGCGPCGLGGPCAASDGQHYETWDEAIRRSVVHDIQCPAERIHILKVGVAGSEPTLLEACGQRLTYQEWCEHGVLVIRLSAALPIPGAPARAP